MWVAHGWVFMVYVVVAFLLSRKAGWTIAVHHPGAGRGPDPAAHLLGGARRHPAAPRRAPRAGRDERGLIPMTTAFVLGGGGVLGAVEVGMLRALLRARHHARPGARHQRRRPQRRDGRPRPDARRDRPADRLWQGAGRGPRGVRRPRGCARSAARCRPAPTSTPPAAAAAARGRARRPHVRGAAGPVPGVRRQHRAGRRALVHHRPLVDAVVASAAVPGLLPPAKVGGEHFLDGGIVNSIPVGRAVAARRHPDLRAPGRPDRPAAEAAAAAVGGGPGVVRDRPAAPVRPRDGELPDGVEAHVLPARGTSSRDDSLLAYRDFSGVQRADRRDVRGLASTTCEASVTWALRRAASWRRR